MISTSRSFPVAHWLLPVALLLAMPGIARAQGVQAALLPQNQTVAPGSEFDIEIAVTQAGSPFNGFEAVVSYNPAALTFLQASPVSLQQGCLMTGACSGACGNTFHVFAAAGDSVKTNLGLLCDQISLSGPGQVYKLHFKASNTPQLTTLSIRRAAFFNSGLLVTPLSLTGCTVGIGVVLDAGPAPGTSGLGVRAQPNPFRNGVQLSIEASVAGVQDLRVLDLLGRTVRILPAGGGQAGARQVVWDGRNESGSRVPAGIYLVQLRIGDRVRLTRVTKLW
jgi:hypothetical protein